jgi:DNA repair protein RecN (Recombination protein N)
VLVSLQIKNYAIIDTLEVNFSNGFNIITGETGAGKSIVLGALGLLLGDRAEISVLKNQEAKCIVEGIFNIKHLENLQSEIEELDIELTPNEIIIRREIAPNGKSRAFINDTPVNISQLKLISTKLVDLHQQFDTLALGEINFQRNVVDGIAKHQHEVNLYKKEFSNYTKLQKELIVLKENQSKSKANLDYNQFLYEELETANLQPNELELLEEEIKMLQNAEIIKANLLQASNALYTADQNIIASIKQVNQILKNVAAYNKNIEALQNRLQSSIVELSDINDEIEQLNDNINLDAERLEIVNDRINIGYKLLKKHNVQTTDELIEIKNHIALIIDNATNIDDIILEKERSIAKLQLQLEKTAAKLHATRVQVAQPLTKKINELLAKVGMPNAQIKIEVKESVLNNYGNSEIIFLFDANKSGKFETIAKVASGGELSRLMLCIKSLVADAIDLPVLIFDEIDTGISGEAAKQVGLIMADLARLHQIICITHQPQIAAMAKAHYFVFKSTINNSITTQIKLLNKDERITTIAQMLSGTNLSNAALSTAKEMINLQ